MFLKSFKLKSNALLKGSDAKKFRQRLEKAFPSVTSEEIQIILRNKANITTLKLVTHNDFQTHVYCVDKLPMFFEIENGAIAPTLYALWQLPNLLPYFTTVSDVLPKLSNGADLMLPGVVPQGTGMNIYGRYKKDQLVAINLTSNKSAVGVGILTRSSDDLYMCGGRGSAVKILHIFGDKLWGVEPSLTQQIPINKPADLKEDDFPPIGTDVRKSEPPQNVKASTIINPKEEDQVATVTEILDENNDSPITELSDLKLCDPIDAGNNHDKELIDMDTILRNAFLAALKNNGKSLTLPLLTSNFYRLYVVPETKTAIDLKKTKYKKLSNFLSQMVEEGFLVIREEAKGVDKIISIDLDHTELVNFITDFKESNNVSSDNQPLYHSELTELYIVTDETVQFFTKMNYKRGEGIPGTQIKKIVREYISKNNLQIKDSITKSIALDDCLEQICERKDAPLKTICNIIQNKMDRSYQMRSIKDVPTNKPLIQMSIATRSGNKKVTLVSNVECYGIILPEFIKLCKQGAAASATTVKLPNQKREMLQIQGNQIRFIFNLLTETYKVPAKFILGLELAKGEKKKKK